MRERVRGIRRDLRFLWHLRVLPRRVAWFQWRAWRLANRTGDDFSPVAATRPPKLAELLRLAEGRLSVAELGTAAGWTTLSLLLADERRRVTSHDIVDRPQRQRYLELVPSSVRERLAFVARPGSDGPTGEQPIDLLYIDSSHDYEPTIAEFAAWRHVLSPGAMVVFDDFGHAGYPGVEQAVRELGLSGEAREGLFVHRVGTARRVR